MSSVGTVGNKLNEMDEGIEIFCQKEMKNISNTLSPQMDAANDVQCAVDNARVAWTYPGYLEKYMDRVDQVVQQRLKELDQMILDLLASKIEGIRGRSLLFISRLGLNDEWQPTLNPGIDPVLITKDDLVVVFKGRFKHVKKTPRPQFVVYFNRRPFGAMASEGNITETSVTIGIDPKSLIFSETAQRHFHYIKASFTTQYESGSWTSNIRNARYTLRIGAYPLTPGIIRTLGNPKWLYKRRIRSMTFSLQRVDFLREDKLIREIVVQPTKGWKLAAKPNALLNGKTPIGSVDGGIPITLVLENEPEVETFVEFDEVNETDHLVLPWGEKQLIDRSQLPIEVETFDGQKLKIEDVDQSKPYLKVRSIGTNILELTAEPPKL
jgi:hypothetical protein